MTILAFLLVALLLGAAKTDAPPSSQARRQSHTQNKHCTGQGQRNQHVALTRPENLHS